MAALASTSVSFQEIISTSNTAAGAFFSGLSAAYSELHDRWASGVTSEAQRFADIVEANRRAYAEAASWARAFAEGATQAGDVGVGRIMQKWADIYAARAAQINAPVIDAAAAYAESVGHWQRHLDSFARQVPNFGTDFARNIGPIVDAVGLGQGIIDLINTGDASGYEKAAWGVTLAEGFAAAAIIGAGMVGVSGAIPIAIAAGIGATIGSVVGGTWGTEIGNTIRDAIPPELWDMYFDTGTAVSRSIPAEVWDFIFGATNRIKDGINSVFGTATTPIRRDPLAIDLDADGIETVGINGANPILFDHNADGIRTGTGWLAPDDAWLALDRNGNGSIDSGRELFGVDTEITVTETVNGVSTTVTRNATSGFEALRTLDGNGDNLFNAQDSAFAQVRLWRDLNQDGISQANELSTLADHGIVSIGLTPTSTTTNLGNGNTVTGTATVITSSGATTEVDSVDLTAGNLNLADNPFYRDFTDTVPVTETARGLPDMGGSGALRDLRQAMSLGTAQSGALVAAVQAFAGATTRAAQQAHLDAVLSAWAGTASPVASTAAGLPGQVQRLAIATSAGVDFAAFGAAFGAALDERGLAWRQVTGTTGEQVQALGQMLQTAGLVRGHAIKASGTNFSLDYWNQSALGAYVQSQPVMGGRIAVLEQFNGTQAYTNFMVRVSTGHAMDGYRINVPQANMDLFNQAYEALRESVYGSLVVQTRLRPYLDDIQLVIDDAGIRFDTGTLAARVEAGRASGDRKVLVDLIELNRYSQDTLQAVGFDGLGTLRGWMEGLLTDSPLRAALAELRVLNLSSGTATGASEIIFGTTSGDVISAGAGDDILTGGDGNDTLNGNAGNDVILGDPGADTLHGEAGNDTLDGGAGNDTLNGGLGNNTYRFGRGDGQDVISYTYDTTATRTNTVQFKDGVAPADVIVSRTGDDLLLGIASTTDQVRVQLFFYQDNPASAYNSVQQVAFADGTTWDLAGILTELGRGTAGNDTTRGTVGDDVLNGQGGNDALNGAAGNDTLNGQDGADTLHGEAGNDTLDGGAGNDTLNGGAGNDTYLFTPGAGADTLSDYDTTAGNTDLLSFGTGITAEQLWFRQVGSNLEVSLLGTSDRMTITNWYSGSAYHVEQFRTADGQTLLDTQVQALVSAMAAFAPPAQGQTTLPQAYQDALAPVIAANWQ
jgi:Ca2+-binding RTX toxin-like protein